MACSLALHIERLHFYEVWDRHRAGNKFTCGCAGPNLRLLSGPVTMKARMRISGESCSKTETHA